MKKSRSIVPGKNIVFYKIFLFALISILLGNSTQAQEMNEIIEDDSFLIVENLQKIYTGIYKHDEPYSGYFAKGNREFPRVDYYEEGKPVYQYSIDVYQMAIAGEMGDIEEEDFVDISTMSREEYENYQRELYKPKLNIKSVYKNGKIIDGYEYEEASSMIFSKKISDGNVVEFHMDVFGMHFYQRISILLQEDQIRIISPFFQQTEDTLETIIYQKNGMWVADCGLSDDKQPSIFFARYENQDFPPNSLSYIYEIANTTYYFGNSVIENNMEFDLLDLSRLYVSNPKAFGTSDITNHFNALIETYRKALIEEKSIKEVKPDNIRAFFVTNQDGLIKDGVRFFAEGDHGYYITYNDAKKSKKTGCSLKEFQEIVIERIRSGNE